jgi:hypothetical protein
VEVTSEYQAWRLEMKCIKRGEFGEEEVVGELAGQEKGAWSRVRKKVIWMMLAGLFDGRSVLGRTRSPIRPHHKIRNMALDGTDWMVTFSDYL